MERSASLRCCWRFVSLQRRHNRPSFCAPPRSIFKTAHVFRREWRQGPHKSKCGDGGGGGAGLRPRTGGGSQKGAEGRAAHSKVESFFISGS